MDVNGLQQILGISHSGVSQNLSVLRSHRLVKERREGRHVIYSLLQPKLATWLLDGLEFLEAEIAMKEEILGALEEARNIWRADMQAEGPNDSRKPIPSGAHADVQTESRREAS
jgi:Predicted transcriptional regulators